METLSDNVSRTGRRGASPFYSLAAAALALGLSLLGSGASAQAPPSDGRLYEFKGSIPLGFSPAYLDSDKDGRLFVAGRNLRNQEAAVSAYVVRQPATDFSLEAFDTAQFQPGYGYAGAAVDEQGNIYLTADTGDKATCFIKKFQPDLTLDPDFGSNGVRTDFPVRPRGCAARGDYLLVAFSGGFIHVFDARDGTYLHLIPSDEGGRRIRDISIEPKAQQVFGVGQGGIYFWSGGTLDNAKFYKLRVLREPGRDATPLEGVAYHPYLAAIFHVSNDPPQVRMLTAQGESVQLSQLDSPHLRAAGDIAFSPDYQVMYVSDPLRQAIHYALYRDPVNPPLPQGGLAAMPMSQAGPGVEGNVFSYPDVQARWHDTLVETLVEAASRDKIVAIYFRNARSALCEEMERGMFAGPQLFSAFPDALWLKVDLDEDPEGLAKQFGIFRAPTVAVFNRSNEMAAMLAGDQITEQAIREALGKQ